MDGPVKKTEPDAAGIIGIPPVRFESISCRLPSSSIGRKTEARLPGGNPKSETNMKLEGQSTPPPPGRSETDRRKCKARNTVRGFGIFEFWEFEFVSCFPGYRFRIFAGSNLFRISGFGFRASPRCFVFEFHVYSRVLCANLRNPSSPAPDGKTRGTRTELIRRFPGAPSWGSGAKPADGFDSLVKKSSPHERITPERSEGKGLQTLRLRPDFVGTPLRA
jgi:hypothetical protein